MYTHVCTCNYIQLANFYWKVSVTHLWEFSSISQRFSIPYDTCLASHANITNDKLKFTIIDFRRKLLLCRKTHTIVYHLSFGSETVKIQTDRSSKAALPPNDPTREISLFLCEFAICLHREAIANKFTVAFWRGQKVRINGWGQNLVYALNRNGTIWMNLIWYLSI